MSSTYHLKRKEIKYIFNISVRNNWKVIICRSIKNIFSIFIVVEKVERCLKWRAL